MPEAAEDRQAITPTLAVPSEVLSKYERILTYGDPGTGKSFMAGTAPEPVWFLTPGGPNELKTVFSKSFIDKHGRREIYISSVKEDREKGQMMDNPSGYDRCCDAVDDFLEWNETEGIGVQTIVVDNATVLEEYMLNKAIYAEYMMAGSTEKTALKKERDYGIRKPHDSTWGGAQSFMDRWVSWLMELPFHIILNAHVYEVYSTASNSRERVLKKVLPLFVGKQRTLIPNSFDNVWYAHSGGGGRSKTWAVQTEGDQLVTAKTRVGGILDPDNERNPNVTEILEEFKEHAESLEEE